MRCEVVTLSSPGTVLSTTIRAGVECGVTPAQSVCTLQAPVTTETSSEAATHQPPDGGWWVVMVTIITPEHTPGQWSPVLTSAALQSHLLI